MDKVIEIKKSYRHIRMLRWIFWPLAVLVMVWPWWMVSDLVKSSPFSLSGLTLLFWQLVVAVPLWKVPDVALWIAKRSSYRLTEFGIEKESGLIPWTRSSITIPYSAIRIITTQKRDIDYLCPGSGSLMIDCAGSSMPEIKMWSIENAAEIKAEIERRMRG